MYVQLHHENYGYATATYGDYVAVGDPNVLRYTSSAPTTYYTGSVDYYRYNKNTDQHDLIGTLYARGSDIEVLLARETGSDVAVRDPLHTELGTLITSDKDLSINKSNHFSELEDAFGGSLDMYGKFLMVGIPYYSASFIAGTLRVGTSGSCVDIFDLSKTETNINNDPYVYTIRNPDLDVSESFGIGVAINSNWMAVGSPLVSSSYGMVYIYQNLSTGSGHYSWSLFQKVESPTLITNQLFGWSVKLNKQSGTYSGSMVVGCGLTSSNEAYYFEFISGSWTSSYTFKPTNTIYPLTFGNYPPYLPTMSVESAFGYDVSLYDSTVVIGAYADRKIYEYTGSYQYEQGAVYIFEKCPGMCPSEFRLALKTNGPSRILKNNKLGFSVDAYGNYVVAGSPKTDILEVDTCYIMQTLKQLQYCEQDLENSSNGQVLLLQKNTSSLEWEIVNVYQKKKRYLSPHRCFGYDVSVDGKSMVVGAPILLSGSRQIEIESTSSNRVAIDNMTGKAYIYNLPNLHEEFHVGNVFYRNGKIVIMTSGSSYEGLFLDPTSYRPYEYDLTFDSQQTIHEKQILCDVRPGEFNVSTNPTALVGVASSLDLNKNGVFDFQDVDVLLRYMQYKENGTTDWSSSYVTADDEMSFYNYNASLWTNTNSLWSSSFDRFENVDVTFLDTLDINYDNKVDESDMAILWKYFSNRLTENNFAGYVNLNCRRRTINEAMDYLDSISKKRELPQILPEFFNYETLSASDKTGSFLAPMVTTIGLYDGLELVAVAKLASPIKLPKTLPINFIVKFDF